MPAIQSSVSLVELVQTLQEQQAAHAAATQDVAATLAEQQEQQEAAAEDVSRTLIQISNLLSALLGGLVDISQPMASAPKAAAAPAAPKPAAASPASKPQGPGRRSSYGTTGIDSVLGFIKKHGDPTTQDLAKHWSSENRGGKVDHTLSRLFKDKQVKRLANPDGRGSRYTLP